MARRAVQIEADGGSRGNPGPAAYGAVLFDADTREVIAERAETIGVATNNVAEYRGLIAGLELYQEHAPEAELEVRMDSKLVVEQMSGRWKIKHPDMKPAGHAGQPAGAARDDVHLDPAGAEQARRPDPQRGAGPAAGGPRPTADRRLADEPADREATEPPARLVAGRTPDHPGAGAARGHRAHPRQAVLQRARRQQPGDQRRGPRAGPGHGRLAGAAGRGDRRRHRLAGAAHPRVRGDPRRAARPGRCSPRTGSPRWSSAPGTG